MMILLANSLRAVLPEEKYNRKEKRRKKMSLNPQRNMDIPEETVRLIRIVLPKGNIYTRMRDRLGTCFNDEQFKGMYARVGQPGYSPWRLALVSIIQYMEDLSDRQVAEELPVRVDWKYLLGLEVEDPGFHYSVLSEFRDRVIAGGSEAELLETLLKVFKEVDLLKKGGQQRSDSTHVVGAVRQLNRWEMLGETMRGALNDLATVAPRWVQEITPSEWYKRYERRIESARLPKGRAKREVWIQAVGEDGIYLLRQVYESAERDWLQQIPSVQVLRQVWVHQFYYEEGQLHLREKDNLPPASIRFDSPYDPEVHYSTKRKLEWSGYKVHLTETCEPDQPHLITHVETTPATLPDVATTETIHQALADKGLLPKTHLVDAGYVDADGIVDSREQLGVELFGPVRSQPQPANQVEGRFTHQDFYIDWQAETVTCPNEADTISWRLIQDAHGSQVIQARFSLKDCRPCLLRALCTSSKSVRVISFRPQAQFEALQQTRQLVKTETWQKTYARRAGIEGTISQAVRTAGLRQARYIGLAKTHLQHVLTAAAINISRVDAWFTGKKRARTRVSRFAALAPVPT
jgi:transposase